MAEKEGLSQQELEGHDVEQLPEREEMALLTTNPSATVPVEGGVGDGIVAHDGVPPGVGGEDAPGDEGGTDPDAKIQPYPENAPPA